MFGSNKDKSSKQGNTTQLSYAWGWTLAFGYPQRACRLLYLKNSLFVVVYYVDEQCTIGWRGYKGHCFFFSSDRKDWLQAKVNLQTTLYHLFLNYSVYKNELIEMHGMLSGNNMASYSIGHPLQRCWIPMQMGGAYTMVQHVDLNIVP